MILVAAALSDHLHFSAGAVVIVGRLAKGINAKFLNTLNRREDNTRGHAVELGAASSSEVSYVGDGAAGHVISVVAAINRKRVLILESAGHKATRAHTWLKRHQSACVPAEVRQ